jgi:hypothetical protein
MQPIIKTAINVVIQTPVTPITTEPYLRFYGLHLAAKSIIYIPSGSGSSFVHAATATSLWYSCYT